MEKHLMITVSEDKSCLSAARFAGSFFSDKQNLKITLFNTAITLNELGIFIIFVLIAVAGGYAIVTLRSMNGFIKEATGITSDTRYNGINRQRSLFQKGEHNDRC